MGIELSFFKCLFDVYLMMLSVNVECTATNVRLFSERLIGNGAEGSGRVLILSY
jgi:hypothetical protein